MEWLKLSRLKGKDKLETYENFSMLFLGVGVVILVLGIFLSSISQAGIPAIMSIFGSFITFIFTVVLVILWVFKSLKNDSVKSD